MRKISRHFRRSEFACGCGCGFDPVDAELLKILEKVRNFYKKPVIVHCGCRCITHNLFVGSKPTSQHIKGKAVDFHIHEIGPEEIANWVEENCLKGRGGIGIYPWGVHIDVRDEIARWRKEE